MKIKHVALWVEDIETAKGVFAHDIFGMYARIYYFCRK